jgi:hypothetical protein
MKRLNLLKSERSLSIYQLRIASKWVICNFNIIAMKKYFLSLIVIATCFPVFATINHGSIMGGGLPLYPMRDGAAPGNAVSGVTFSFKAVTVGTKTWVWTDLNGKYIDGNNWSSRFRFWYPAIAEYNLSDRIAGAQQTYGITGIPDVNFYKQDFRDINPCVITFLQESNNVFYETADIAYTCTRPNPANANDQTPPALNPPAIVGQTAQQLRLSLSASDNSEHFFYYIEDAENNFVEISFFDETVLNLDPDKTYRFSIYAVDFSGNQSEAKSVFFLPDSIRNGSDFYIISMDLASESSLETQTAEKSMFRSIDIWADENHTATLTGGSRSGVNAWGLMESWVALDVAESAATAGWNGGAFVAVLNSDNFPNGVPNLKPVTDNPSDYCFHFAVKSPATQPGAGLTLIFYSDSTPGDAGLKYYVGPDTVKSAFGLPWLGNYAHDGQWHHFEIPVSQLVERGYKWGGPLSAANGRVYLLGFQSPATVPGTELNLDAVFFYKKPSGYAAPPPAPQEPVFNEGKAAAINFNINSRSLNKLQIECISDVSVRDAFVGLELNGVRLAGQWKPIITDPVNGTTRYLITIPAREIHGWRKGAVLGLNFGYLPTGGGYVSDNKVITAEGENHGLPILHRIGDGVAVNMTNLPDSIGLGSDFYIIYMDSVNEASLETQTAEKSMLRSIDIWADENQTATLTGSSRSGVNAWGIGKSWVALDVAESAATAGWNGGAIVAVLNSDDFPSRVPNLKPVTDNPADYCFHFAVKSPATQPDAGWTLIFYSDSTPGDAGLKYYVGPDTVRSAFGLPWLGNYAHDGQWHHFEIPVSQLVERGYKWGGPLSAANGRVYLLGFQSPANVPGTELNLDAVFFYKKPSGYAMPPPTPQEPVFNEGKAGAINFKINSRLLNELQIECISDVSVSDAFVGLELNGVRLAGQWKPVITDPVNNTTRYLITIPAREIHGWKKGAVLGLNFGYLPTGGGYVNDNKVITAEGGNHGLPILHRIGDGVAVNMTNLPDSIGHGSDFYIILMDKVSQDALGAKVKEPMMMRDYDVWPDGKTLEATNYSGINAFGEPYSAPDVVWTAFKVTQIATNYGWNGGAIVGKLDEYENGPPNLKDITDNPGDYYFHFAIKSPEGQSDAGCVLIFFSDGTPTTTGGGGLKYYFGTKGSINGVVGGATKLGNYTHNGEWQHIEIPVSRLVSDGYKWDGPIRVWEKTEDLAVLNRPILLGFQQDENIAGYEINLDAIFFYKKPAQ